MALALTTKVDVEQDAIRRCQAGDIDALGELFELNRDAVLRTAYVVIGRLGLAEDVTQEVFLELWRSIKRFTVGRPFAPWLHSIVYRRSLDELRRQSRRPSVPLEEVAELPSPFTSPEEAAELSELQRAVWLALECLTVRQRATLGFKHFQQFSEAEMAVALECSRGRVKSLLHEANMHFREVYAPPTSGDGLPPSGPGAV